MRLSAARRRAAVPQRCRSSLSRNSVKSCSKCQAVSAKRQQSSAGSSPCLCGASTTSLPPVPPDKAISEGERPRRARTRRAFSPPSPRPLDRAFSIRTCLRTSLSTRRTQMSPTTNRTTPHGASHDDTKSRRVASSSRRLLGARPGLHIGLTMIVMTLPTSSAWHSPTHSFSPSTTELCTNTCNNGPSSYVNNTMCQDGGAGSAGHGW